VKADHLPLLTKLTRRMVFDALQNAELTVSELGSLTGLPHQSVAAAVEELEHQGWAVSRQIGGEAPGCLIRLAVDAAYVFGADIGGTKVAAALADAGGTIVSERTEPTDPRGGELVFDQIERLAGELACEAGTTPARIASVVAGFPGAVDPVTNKLSLVPNITGLDGLNAKQQLAERFSATVALENDVNLAVLGEVASGCAQDVANVALLALGTGTGLGLILGGRLVRGATGGAGEIAYLPVGGNVTSPEALSVGAFESDVGSIAMLRRYQQNGCPEVTSVRTMFDRLNAGDEVAEAVLNHTARSVALAITALQALLDLDLIVLGGGIGTRPELVERVRRDTQAVFARPVRILASALGSRAGVVGAVYAAANNLRDQAFGPPILHADSSWSHALSAVATAATNETRPIAENLKTENWQCR
jgi:predicted NBD/HSP70 family sugar kinase